MRILNFGSLNIDITYSVKNFARAGETVAANGVSRHAGGKGFNQSVALARAGAEVCHAGCIGSDGLFLKEKLCEENVNVEYLMSAPTPTGTAVIQVNQEGNNCILLYSGANACIDRTIVNDILKNFTADDILLVQNETSALRDMVEAAASKGMRIAINPSPMKENICSDIIKNATWLFVNEIEAAEISGDSDIDCCIDKLSATYPDTQIIMTLGSRGVLYRFKEKMLKKESYCVNAVDTTGAGDTFTGYFLASALSGHKIPEALDIASKAAAISVTRSGAYESIPYMEDVLRFNCGYN